MLAAMLVCFAGGCGTEKLASPGEKEAVSSQVEEKSMEKPKNDKKVETEEEYLDADSVEAEEVDYSKYEEQNSTEGQNSGNDETKKDQYQTDPVPEGMPEPVEPDNAEVDTSSEEICYISISCSTILDNIENLKQGKESLVPSDGVILEETEVSFYEGESVFDVLQRVTQNNRIHMESSFTPMYNSAYIEGINNLYEFDCGKLSGWKYSVNGWYPNYGCSRYQVQAGDVIEWNYTCDNGRDLQ